MNWSKIEKSQPLRARQSSGFGRRSCFQRNRWLSMECRETQTHTHTHTKWERDRQRERERERGRERQRQRKGQREGQRERERDRRRDRETDRKRHTESHNHRTTRSYMHKWVINTPGEGDSEKSSSQRYKVQCRYLAEVWQKRASHCALVSPAVLGADQVFNNIGDYEWNVVWEREGGGERERRESHNHRNTSLTCTNGW